MKSTISSVALVASLLLAVSAIPLQQREAAIEIDVVTAYEVATAYATVFETEGAPAATPTAPSSPVYVAETTTVADTGKKGHTRPHYWHTSETTSSTTYVAPAPETTSTSTSTSEAPVVTFVPPTTSEAPAFTPPAFSMPAFSPPAISAPAFTAPVAPTTTSTYQAPAAAPTAATAPSSYSGDDSYSDANMQLAIINSTNTYRTMFQAAPVTWNQSLVDMAAASVASCNFEHTNAGQNLAAGYSGPQASVGAWGDEYKSFDFSKPDFGEDTGHFTQLVWQDTTTTGCAAKKCPTDGSTSASGWFLICNYFPVGNMLGEFPQNVKSKVS